MIIIVPTYMVSLQAKGLISVAKRLMQHANPSFLCFFS